MSPNVQSAIECANLHARSLVSGDIAALEVLLDDTLVWIHGSAKVDTKESFLAPFREGPSRYRVFERSVEKVRDFGETVIMHGTVNIVSVSGEVERTLRNRFIAVWIGTGPQRRLAAWQSTRDPG